ncbi:signal peptidase I [Nocardioides nematodiphilus]|uniref:signal peptidase I n=1 Tax=Nocardioides nematodiphilus TaxID=2849669 RepID=UPI001CDA20B1|nr:signal peptidase I [Nocardioides nematodiphilus]MCA1983332.1 signal peptidase I [Nocardioides nematodiphilus]
MVLGVAAVAVFLLAMLTVVVGLTFSVQVSGHSMEPTLHNGDRLEVNLLQRHDIHRFDLVEAIEPAYPGSAGGLAIVKRVIALPGDRIAIAGGEHPVVYLRPAGEKGTFRVDNPAWPTRIGADTASCCTKGLTGGDKERWRTLSADDYFVMGDNWGGSTDSRVFGPIPEDSIKAKLSFRILPRSRFGSIANTVKLVPMTP